MKTGLYLRPALQCSICGDCDDHTDECPRGEVGKVKIMLELSNLGVGTEINCSTGDTNFDSVAAYELLCKLTGRQPLCYEGVKIERCPSASVANPLRWEE
jgi:hypothetical protein